MVNIIDMSFSYDSGPTDFNELLEQDAIDPPEFLETFRRYAENGWGIDGSAVIELVERTECGPSQLSYLGHLADLGIENQVKGGQASLTPFSAMKEQIKYLQVLSYARSKIAEISRHN